MILKLRRIRNSRLTISYLQELGPYLANFMQVTTNRFADQKIHTLYLCELTLINQQKLSFYSIYGLQYHWNMFMQLGLLENTIFNI